jgi:hypothetical protein
MYQTVPNVLATHENVGPITAHEGNPTSSHPTGPRLSLSQLLLAQPPIPDLRLLALAVVQPPRAPAHPPDGKGPVPAACRLTQRLLVLASCARAGATAPPIRYP